MNKKKNVLPLIPLFLSVSAGLMVSESGHALPFSIIPKITLPQSVPINGSVYAYYTVSNNTGSLRNNNFVKYMPPHVTQVIQNGTYADTCGSTFNLAANGQAGSSCTLQLKISGAVNSNDPDQRNHLFVCFPGGKSCAGTNTPINVKQQATPIAYYQQWIKSLGFGYRAVQGNAFLMTNADCSEFISIFGSCFGQNPAAPYIIPQPPIENSYTNPTYAQPLNTPGPQGETNIIYRLSTSDALVSIISYPPQAAYFGYQSYLFTSETSNYTGITPPRTRTVSPDPSRYEIFGSLGNDINNIIVQNQFINPWGGTTIMYITTSNMNLAQDLIANANMHGIDPSSIFIEPVGSNVIPGNNAQSDDMISLIRYAVPKSTSAADAWLDNLSNNVLVYKVSNLTIPVSRYGVNQYTAHTINNSELNLATAQQQLVALLKTYLAAKQLSPASSVASTVSTINNASGVPTEGLVGSYCIYYGVNCEGDNQDTSTYSFLALAFIDPLETAFIVGINHSMLNNNRYVSVDIYNADTSAGVASSSQTNPSAVGFNSGILTGSAEQVVQQLGISIPPGNTQLIENISQLYVTFIARDCTNSTIAAANQYCINLMGSSLVPLTSPISITERSYIMPGQTTGGNVNYMLYPIVVAATHNFPP